jgi:hypothetical protein
MESACMEPLCSVPSLVFLGSSTSSSLRHEDRSSHLRILVSLKIRLAPEACVWSTSLAVQKRSRLRGYDCEHRVGRELKLQYGKKKTLKWDMSVLQGNENYKALNVLRYCGIKHMQDRCMIDSAYQKQTLEHYMAGHCHICSLRET